jgi:hypothetical protein
MIDQKEIADPDNSFPKAIKHPDVDSEVHMQALFTLGSIHTMHRDCVSFFDGTHQKLPILSKSKFQETLLGSLANGFKVEFTTLCLIIKLLQAAPSSGSIDKQRSIYTMAKTITSLLESSNVIPSYLLECKVLLTFYEIGQGLNTAAYLSVGACARLARILGLHRKPWKHRTDELIGRAIIRTTISVEPVDYYVPENGGFDSEEAKRIWWAITNMDRFINLANGDSQFVTEDPETSDPLPNERSFRIEAIAGSIIPTLATPSDIAVGQMARECQASHLSGFVVKQIFSPLSHENSMSDEAVQIERTLKSFLPLLLRDELESGRFCGSFGICNSALFSLYEFWLNLDLPETTARQEIWQSMVEVSENVITYAKAAYGDGKSYRYDLLSPFLLLSQYQAAIVQYRLWKQGSPASKQLFTSMIGIIGNCSTRWAGASESSEFTVPCFNTDVN